MAKRTSKSEQNKPARFVVYYEAYGHQHTLELVCETEQEAIDFMVNMWDIDPKAVTLHKVM